MHFSYILFCLYVKPSYQLKDVSFLQSFSSTLHDWNSVGAKDKHPCLHSTLFILKAENDMPCENKEIRKQHLSRCTSLPIIAEQISMARDPVPMESLWSNNILYPPKSNPQNSVLKCRRGKYKPIKSLYSRETNRTSQETHVLVLLLSGKCNSCVVKRDIAEWWNQPRLCPVSDNWKKERKMNTES